MFLRKCEKDKQPYAVGYYEMAHFKVQTVGA
jgi:hypothetical protein